MAINFPASPSVNDTFTVGSITYQCVQNNPTKWIGLGVTPADRLVEGSNSLEINANNDLVWTGNQLQLVDTAETTASLFINGTKKSSWQAQDNFGNILYSYDGEPLIFSTSSAASFSEKLRIASNGNVGIGDNNPSDKLNVKGDSTTSSGIFIHNANGATNSSADLWFGNWSGATSATPQARISALNKNVNTAATDLIFEVYTGNTTEERLRVTSGGQVLIGTDIQNSFNGVGQEHNLIVAGSTSNTSIVSNSGAAITISNKDGTADNTAGLHFAREDTDGNPHYSGASIVAQFKETQVTGQYPKADLVFLTSIAANNAPSEKMRVHADGNIEVVSGSVLGKFYASNTATLELTDWTAGVGWRVIEVFGKSNPNSAGSGGYADPIHVYLYHGQGWNGSALTSYLYLQDQAPLARNAFPSGSGGSANQLTVEWFDGTTAVSGATGVPAGAAAYYPRLTTAQSGGSSSVFHVRVIRRF